MKKLTEGVINFKKRLTEEDKALFAQAQDPEVLFITCSDSRILPHLKTSTSPGELFVVRNVGNLTPPKSAHAHSVAAALQFGLLGLNVSHIVICGHAECGAMQALLNKDTSLPYVTTWLEEGKTSLKSKPKGLIFPPSLSKVNQLSQINVLQQLENLKTYPFVAEKLKNKQLTLHGWWFDINTSSFYHYDPDQHLFKIFKK